MARNDYMQEPVEMIALQNWSGREGKIRRGQKITVTEARARELEGYGRTRSPRMSIDGTRVEAGQPIVAPARARRVMDSATTKGGPTADDRKGRPEKEVPEGKEPETTETKPAPDATASARKSAQELGVDLAEIMGSGAGGRITKPDVEYWAPPNTGDAQLDRFITDLRDCTLDELHEQRELYADEPDMRYVRAVDAEIGARQ